MTKQSDKVREGLKARDRERRSRHTELAAVSSAPRRLRNTLVPELPMVWRSLDELKGATRRVRKADEAQIARIMASIEAHGVCRPVTIDAVNFIIDGHLTAEAARRLGVERIQCVDGAGRLPVPGTLRRDGTREPAS